VKAFFLGGVALVAVAIGDAARAVDLEQQPFKPRYDSTPPGSAAYDRSGFYGGIVGGGVVAMSDHTFVDGTVDTGDFNVRGGMLGGTFGFGYQNGPWVLAMENDLEWTHADGGVGMPGGAFSTKLQWLYNYRARVGYAFDRFVPYIAFGPTFGGVQIATTIPGLGEVSNRETRSGWTLGAGWEYAITPDLAAKVEYLFICLGQSTQFSLDNVEFMGHFVRAGLNYRFDWAGGRATDVGSTSMPAKAPAAPLDYRWSGVYVGFNVGGSAGKRSTEYSLAGVPIGAADNWTNGAFRGIGFHGLAGIQAGYNWQIEHLLLGLEADFQLTQLAGQSLNSRFVAVSGAATGTLDSAVEMPLLGTIRGRLGYTADRWLFYVTGGLAYGEVQTSSTFTVPAIGTVTSSSETTPMGWAAGAGFEGALWRNWTAKFEYLYLDLGHTRDNFAGVGSFGSIAANSRVAEHIVRAGLNTRFDWFGPH
jgi:outer membrane immunogenic protein